MSCLSLEKTTHLGKVKHIRVEGVMANRPVFIPNYGEGELVKIVGVEFKWHPGMAASQRQKSVVELHHSAIKNNYCKKPLEVSTKSTEELGIQLSAFNLSSVSLKQEKRFTVETAFQSSKVFERGGPYIDLLNKSSREAKQDIRLKESGDLIGFKFFDVEWPLEPKTIFYDWLYINTLLKNVNLMDGLSEYDAFTDIEFNPKKSINCQAYSIALFKSLSYRGLVSDCIKDKNVFIDIVVNNGNRVSQEEGCVSPEQGQLF